VVAATSKRGSKRQVIFENTVEMGGLLKGREIPCVT
jgi:hypothetical protein